MNVLVLVLFVLVLLLTVGAMAVFFGILTVWVRALTSGVPVNALRILGMRLRGNPARLLIDAHVLLSKEGIQTSLDETEHIFMQNRRRVHHPEELVRLVKQHHSKR